MLCLLLGLGSSALGAELTATAWVEPESPTVGDTASLVVQTELLDGGGVLAVSQVSIQTPSVPELDLAEGETPASRQMQTIITGSGSKVRAQHTFRLRPLREGQFEIPSIQVSAQVGAQLLTSRTAPVFVPVRAGSSPVLERDGEGQPNRAQDARQSLYWFLGVALLALALFTVLVIRGALRASRPSERAGPVRATPENEFAAQGRELLARGAAPELMEHCLAHVREHVGVASTGATEALTRREIEERAQWRLSERGAGRLARLLDTAEAVLFAGSAVDTQRLETALLDAAAVAMELRGHSSSRHSERTSAG